MTIRQATIADIGEMHRVRMSVRENALSDYSVLSADKYREHLEFLGRGWVWEQGRRIVGFAVANRVDANIWALFVEPGFERRGVGRALHDNMVSWLRSEGVERITLGTDPQTRAASFYRAAGWQFQRLDASGEAVYELTLAEQ